MQARLRLEILIWSFIDIFFNYFNFFIFNPLKTKSVNKKLDVEESEDRVGHMWENNLTLCESLCCILLWRCTTLWVSLCSSHVRRFLGNSAAVEAILLNLSYSLLCVWLHHAAPFPASSFHFSHWNFKKCLSLRSWFLISSSHELYGRRLERNRTGWGFFCFHWVWYKQNDFSLICFRKIKE